MTDRQASREQAILAAYANNEPLDEIAERHGVNTEEIERLAADGVEMQRVIRCPGPVIVAALLVAASGFFNMSAAGRSLDGAGGVVAGILAVVIYSLTAYGLWKGWRGAQILASIGAGISVLAGLGGGRPLGLIAGGAVLALLLVPMSARDWFSRFPATTRR